MACGINNLQCAPIWAFVPVRTFKPCNALPTLRSWSPNYLGTQLHIPSLRLSTCSSGHRKRSPACVFSSEGKSKDDKGSALNIFEKGMGLLKKDSVEDLLRNQIEKQEYFDDGGSGGIGPGGGGGGGGNGGSGGSEDDNVWDEVVQVVFGTIGFIFLYMLIIEGEEITTFAKDIIKFLFTRKKSIRLQRLIDDWVKTFRKLTEVKVEDPYWLEKAIINTPTWWDSPAKYKVLYRRYLASRYDSN